MMTSLKTWCLLSLSVLLLLSIAPTETEVVQSMTQCNNFVLESNPPHISDILVNGRIMDQNRYKIICQTYKNLSRFVTLYDTENKIPVFSAYKYRGTKGKRPQTPWKIEPQLEERDSMSNMWDDKYKNQASNNDYVNNQSYNRGHLFPSSHAFNETEKISTFTLTNAVPQAITFNNGSWAKMESCVKCVLQKHCLNNNNVPEGFVVTGAKPGTEKLNQKVNIPSVLWSAFCCYSKNKNKWLASAHWGINTAEKPEDSRSKYLKTKTLGELHQELGIEAFPNAPDCPLTETVAEFYPELNLDNNCHCPPQPSTTTAPPTTPSTTAAPTLSTIISTTIVPTTTTSTTRVTTTTTTTTEKEEENPENDEDGEQEGNQQQPGRAPAVGAGGGGGVVGGILGGAVGGVIGAVMLSIAGQGPKVPTTSTTSPLASVLGQTTTTTFIHSATARPTFSTTIPTTTKMPTANFTLTTASTITASLPSNVTANETTTAVSTTTESQTKPPKHHSFIRKTFQRRVRPPAHETQKPVLEAEEGSTWTWQDIDVFSGEGLLEILHKHATLN